MSRTPLLFAGLVLVAAVASAGVGAACVPQPLLLLEPAASGAPGTKLTAKGTSFASGRAELRWNALDGPLLGSATGPDFSVEVTVPDVADGLYAVVGIARSAAGGLAGTSRATLQVVRVGDRSGPPSTAGTSSAPAPTDSGRAPSATPAPVLPLAAGGAVLLAIGGLLGRATPRRRSAPGSDLAGHHDP
ncbi:MAG: hypothetical protein ACRD03_06010 [Acidimicrobiales bacterium]